MSASPPDLDDVTDREVQHNLSWKYTKKLARWEKALERLVRAHDLVAGAGWCFTRVALALTALAALVTTGKAALDVLAQFVRP